MFTAFSKHRRFRIYSSVKYTDRKENANMSKFNEVNGKIADGVTDAYRKIESGVVGGYKAIENGVVGGYKKIESGAVNTFNKVSDKFIGKFFTHDGETVEEAKKRLSKK